MQFDVFSMMWRTAGDDEATVYRHAIDQAAMARSLGYQVFWTAEHHFADPSAPFFGTLSAPPVFLAYLAHAVPDMGIGTAVWVPGLDNPFRVMEQAAVLDLLSNGRLFMGIGQGNRRHLRMFRVLEESRQERYDEFLKLFLQAGESGWAEAPDLGAQKVFPVPRLRRPPQDILWAGVRDRPSLEFAGQMGLGLLIGQLESDDVQAEYAEVYRAAATRAHRRARIAIARMIHVAESDALALAQADLAIRRYHARFTAPDTYYRDRLANRDVPRVDKDIPLKTLAAESLYWVGAPDTVAAKVAALYGRIPFDRLLCMFSVPGLDESAIQSSTKLFAEAVIPFVKRLA